MDSPNRMRLYAAYTCYENDFVGFFTFFEQDKSLSKTLVEGLVADGTEGSADKLFQWSNHPDFMKLLRSYGWKRVACEDRVVDGFQYLAFRFIKERRK